MKIIKISLFSILCFIFFKTQAQEYKVRIAFIGNSITIGSFLTNPTTECYPSQFAALLQNKYSDTCEVKNFAVSGRTMLKNGDYPIWNELSFRNAVNYAPDICYILLGTNDSKPQNWDAYGHEFYDDYISLIEAIRHHNPNTRFIVCYPPPAFTSVYDIRDSIILHGVIPAVDSVLDNTNSQLIDFYHPLLSSSNLFSDGVHPTVAGAAQMANIVFDHFNNYHMIDSAVRDLAFVTDLRFNKNNFQRKDSVTLIWSSFNADSVLINGIKVAEQGSKIMYPKTTSKYDVVAYGPNNTDTLSCIISVYEPLLTKLQLSPASFNINGGESKYINLLYKDQYNFKMIDTVFDVSWSVTENRGSLNDLSGYGVAYYANIKGLDTVVVEYESFIAKSGINIETSLFIKEETENNIFTLSNQNDGRLIVNFKNKVPGNILIKISDLNGRVIYSKEKEITTTGSQVLEFKPEINAVGVYIYEFNCPDNYFTGKIYIN